MSRQLQAGDLLECQFFNVPENKFYGGRWTGELVAITSGNRNSRHPKPYIVERDSGLPTIALHRKEIRRIIGQAPERTMFQACWQSATHYGGRSDYFNRDDAASIMEQQDFEVNRPEKRGGSFTFYYRDWIMWKHSQIWGEAVCVVWTVDKRADGKAPDRRHFTWQDDEGDAMQRAVEFIKRRIK